MRTGYDLNGSSGPSKNLAETPNRQWEVGQRPLIPLRMISVDATGRGAFPALPSHRILMV